MKAFENRLMVIIMILALGLTACEDDITVNAVVHENGSIERSISFVDVDSAIFRNNIFGLQPNGDWQSKVTPHPKKSQKPESVDIIYTRTFASAEQANAAMDGLHDSLLSIHTTFEKQFRWFYTYTTYSDTYRSVNRFKHLSQTNFFTAEDMAFINRMPAEGTPISKADSVYLDHLEQKLEKYFTRAVFEEHLQVLLAAASANHIEQHWIDSLMRHKEKIFDFILRDDDRQTKTLGDAFMVPVIELLKIPFPTEKVKADYTTNCRDVVGRIRFMLYIAGSGKFTHRIQMPGELVSTNADSVNGNAAIWRPVSLKLLLQDYTMQAKSRKLNVWTLLVSGLVIVAAVIGVWKRK